MPTSSSAQPMMAFSSPLLSSVDRLLRGFDSRFGSASFLSTLNRFESFSDRLLGRRLSSLGLPMQSSGFAPRELPPVPTLEHAESWLSGPGAVAARAGAVRSQAVAAPKPASSRVASVGMPMVPPALSAAPAVGVPSAAAMQAPTLVPTQAPTQAPTLAAGIPAVAPSSIPTSARGSAAADPVAAPSHGPDVTAPVAPLNRGVAPSERARSIMPELSDAASSVDTASPGLPGSDEPRGLDLVLRSAPYPSVQRPPSPEILKLSALARSFMHLGWSDARLGIGSSDAAVARLTDAGSLPLARGASATEPGPLQSARIASGSALAQTMVSPDVLAPRAAQAAATTNRTAQTVARQGLAQAEPGRRQESALEPSQSAALGSASAVAASLPVATVTAQSVNAAVRAGAAPTLAPSVGSSAALPVDAVAAAPSAGVDAVGATDSVAARTVAERAVASPRRTVVAEMAELLGPWSPGLSPSMWLGETVSRERAVASNERAQVLPVPRGQTKPLTAPGQISAQVEQFAARMGMATGAPLPSADRPHFSAEWSQAPGLASSVQRLLKTNAQRDSAITERSSPALPMLAAPSLDRASDKLSDAARAVRPVSDRAASRPEKLTDTRVALPMLAPQAAESIGAAARSATLDRRERWEASPLVPSSTMVRQVDAPSPTADREAAAPSSVVPALSSTPSARPWLKMGGVATLAELFAAGVGLSSGVAQRAADSAGLSFSSSVLPSWLSVPARLTQSGAEAAPASVAPALSYLSPDLPRTAVAARDAQAASPSLRREKVSREAVRSDKADAASVAGVFPVSGVSAAHPASFAPSDARTFIDAVASSPDAERSVARPSEPLARIFGQVGGLAASTEAFARAHGIARIEELVGADPSAVAAPSQFVPLAGGQVLVPNQARRAERAIGDLGLSSASAMRAQPAAAPSAASSSFASSARMLPSTWQRPGGMALRSELLATQMTAALPWLQPSIVKQWQNAPGLPSSLAQLLASTDSPDVSPRWAMGPQGLVFVAGPQPERTVRADAGQAHRGAAPQPRVAVSSEGSDPSGRTSARPMLAGQNQLASSVLGRLSESANLSGSSPVLPVFGREDSIAASSQDGTGLRALLGSVAGDLPWLRVGGMGALAELFAASVGVGTGAAQSLAQSLGVSSGRSLTPDWLLSLAAHSGSPEQASRLAALLPSLILPAVSNRGAAQPEPMARQASQGAGALPNVATGTSFRETSTEPRRAAGSLGSLLTGGLAASAESFARQFGMERVAGSSDPSAQTDAHVESAGRWLSVAGGMVFLPKDQPAQLSTGPHANRSASAAVSPSMSVGQLGATALRSEIFSALVGPQRTLGDLVRRSSSQVQPGWDDLSSLLTSLPKSDVTAEPSLPRWGMGGTGGLMFVAAPSAKNEQTALSHRPERASSLRSLFAPKKDANSSSQPGAVATQALSMANRASSLVQPAQHISSPLLSLVAGPSEWNSARRGVSDVEQAYTQRLVTSFPRQAQADGSEPKPTALWPQAMLTQVQRLEKVVSMLPSEWQPSLKVVAALRQSGVAQTPLWQELPKALNTVRPYETADDGESDSAGPEQISASALRSPSLSLVERAAPAPTTPRASTAQTESNKQQSVERAMSEAVASLIKSGGQAAASARLLDAIRTHATNQPTRSDERLNLSDLTMIALSMGQNRIAASSPDHPKDRLEPNVGNALRMKNSKHVEDDKNSYRKTVSEHAEQVLKHMKDQLEKQKLRGQF